MVDMPVLRFGGRQVERRSLEAPAIIVGQLLTTPVPFVEVWKLHPEDRGLDGVEPSVEWQHDVFILAALPVVTDPVRCTGQLGGVRNQHPAIAEGAKVLGWIEAEGSGRS